MNYTLEYVGTKPIVPETNVKLYRGSDNPEDILKNSGINPKLVEIQGYFVLVSNGRQIADGFLYLMPKLFELVGEYAALCQSYVQPTSHMPKPSRMRVRGDPIEFTSCVPSLAQYCIAANTIGPQLFGATCSLILSPEWNYWNTIPSVKDPRIILERFVNAFGCLCKRNVEKIPNLYNFVNEKMEELGLVFVEPDKNELNVLETFLIQTIEQIKQSFKGRISSNQILPQVPSENVRKREKIKNLILPPSYNPNLYDVCLTPEDFVDSDLDGLQIFRNLKE
ncbi:MAG: hypothetical protein QXM68_01135 [Candidatus Aenigmatarchaeota archaeon]|nr:hypothetical protein [Candidatus Aenigmarchaeota archaeon]